MSARPRKRKSRRVKRQERHAHSEKACQTCTRQQLQELQEKDESLAPLRGLIKPQSDAQIGDFYVRDGLLYRKWLPPGRSEEMMVEQLVLPSVCRSTVLSLAH